MSQQQENLSSRCDERDRTGPVPENNAAAGELAKFAVLTGGTLTGVSLVLRTFFHRHQYRSVTLVHGNTRLELKGHEPKRH